jgi:multiple sugar transport system permease protein
LSGLAASRSEKPRRSSRDVGFRLTRLAILGIFVLIGVIPMVWLALAPSKTGPELQSLSPFAFGSIDNYFLAWDNLQSFASAVILRWTFNSFFYTSVIVFVSVSSATLAGFVLAATRFPFKRAWLIITLLAMLIPPVALVLPLFIEIKTLGLFDSPWAVMLTSSFFPFGTFLAYIFYATSIPHELYEAAKMDGCDEYRTFWWVARPLARPLIAILAFFAFVATWTNYFLPFVLLGSTENYTLPLGLGVLFSSTPALNPGVGASQLPIGRPEVALAGLLVALPILVVFLLSTRYLVRGMLDGGVKS